MKFTEFDLKPEIMKAIEEAGYDEPTAIQEKAIPVALDGKDVIAQSETGSGKTAVFGLPIMQKIEAGKGIQSLILTPTRELCVQVTQALEQFGKHLGIQVLSIFGGVDIEPQITKLRSADVVVGTPGRILDHMSRNSINFSHVQFLVLDEVDRMSDMGFIDDVEKILRALPRQRQTMLFSATISRDVHKLASRHMKEPLLVKTQIHVDKSLMKQVYYNIPATEKFSLFVHLLKTSGEGLKLVFCSTRIEADKVARNLKLQGMNAMTIHGGLTQNARMKALDSLRDEKIDILVATDVAARGLDIKNVIYVYNYDVPKNATEYVHRIGRTARAGESGTAVTILCEPDYENFRKILRDTHFDVSRNETPNFQRVRFQAYFEKTSDHLGFGKPPSSGSGFRQGLRRGFSHSSGGRGGYGHGGGRRSSGSGHSSEGQMGGYSGESQSQSSFYQTRPGGQPPSGNSKSFGGYSRSGNRNKYQKRRPGFSRR